MAVFSLVFVLHIVLGIAMLSGSLPMKSGGEPSSPEEQQFVGWLFTVMGVCIVLGGLTLAAFVAYAGRCLSQQRRYLLCMIVAGLACLFTPIGTILGVFTLVVLLRPQVKAAFAGQAGVA
jgi:MFS family permease